MSLRVWKWVVLGVVVLAMLGGLAAGGGYLYLQKRNAKNLIIAEEAFANQDWFRAKSHYSWYLLRHPGDIESLRKFAEASLNIPEYRTTHINDAGRAYLQIVLEHPEDPAHRIALMKFYDKYRLWRNLEYYATSFLREHPDQKELLYYKAIALQRMARGSEAAEVYQKALDAGVMMPEVYGNLALLLRDGNKAEAAEQILRDAAEKLPDKAMASREQARYYIVSKEYDKAAAAAAEALQGMPDDVDTQVFAGQAAMGLEAFDEAERHLKRAVELAPDRVEIVLTLASLYERQTLLEQAVAALDQIPPLIRMNYPEVFFAMIEFQLSLNRLDEAHKTIDAYKLAFPEHETAFAYFAGRELLISGAAKEAAEKLGAVVQRQPDFIRAQFYRAQAYLQNNEPDLAKGTLEIYLHARPDDAVAQDMWRRYFGRPNTLDAAVAAGKMLLDKQDADSRNLTSAAQDFMRLQTGTDVDAALPERLLERALEKDPANLDTYLAYVELLLKQRKSAEAAAVLQRAEAAGIPPADMAFAHAAVALTEGRLPDAQERLAGYLARPGIARADILRAARLLSDNAQLEAAIALLQKAAGERPAETLELELDCIGLSTEAGEPERALALAEDLESRMEKQPDMVRRIQEKKSEVAAALFDRDVPDRAKVEPLLAAGLRAMPESQSLKALQARLRLYDTPPDLAGAQQVGESVLQNEPENIEALLLLYDVSMARGRHDLAAGYARRAGAAAPGNWRVRRVVVESLLDAGQHGDAVKGAEALLAVRPGDGRALALAFRAFGESGNADGARKLFDKIKERAAADAGAVPPLERLEGMLAYYERNFAQGEQQLRTYLKTHPGDSGVLDLIVATLLQQDKAADAEAFLKEQAAAANTADVWCRLGRFYLDLKDNARLPDASSAFARVIQLDANHGMALRGMVDVQLRLRNLSGALGLCERYLKIQPNDAEVLWRKADLLLMERSRLGEALTAIDNALQQYEQPQFFLVRGLILLNMEKYPEALADLQRFADVPGLRSARLDAGLALAYAKMGDAIMAHKFLDSAAGKESDPVAEPLLRRAQEQLVELEKNGTAQPLR